MELNLTGKRALVTGSSRGIGKAIAYALLSEGCKVVINGRNEALLNDVAGDINGFIPIKGDVSQPEEAFKVAERAQKALGGIDILVCNVGSGQSVKPGFETPDEWQRMFSLNLWSATNMIEACKESLTDNKGNVVCVSSICGMEVIDGAPVAYSSAKAALNACIRGLSRPLGKSGVRINGIAPGNILFEGSRWETLVREDPERVQAMLDENVALSRFGTVEEVANLVSILASPLSAFVTGAIWTVDGGQTHS